MKKKSGGVMKANMGRLLETFSPAYSVMKGKGPIANILGMAKGNKVDPMQTEMEKAKAQVVKTQVNIQDNSGSPFGQGNYGELIKKLMKDQ